MAEFSENRQISNLINMSCKVLLVPLYSLIGSNRYNGDEESHRTDRANEY